MDNPVLFVCKDPGGMNGIVPVYDAWVKGGGDAVLIANGKAAELLQQQPWPRPFRWYPTAVSAFAGIPNPAALVTSMCSNGGIGRDLVPLLRGRCPTVALQDFWGGALTNSWRDPECRPDSIVVNDAVGADIVARAWPDMNRTRIVVLGYPALDRYADLDVAALGTQVRTQLGIGADEIVVLYAGQLERTGEMLEEVVAALEAIGKSVCLLPRMHPRMVNDAPEEVARCAAALRQFRVGRIIDSTACTTDACVAAVTVVVSMYSTVLVEAAAVRKPAIAVLYPAVADDFQKSTGGTMDDFPLVLLDACQKSTDRWSLKKALEWAFDGAIEAWRRPAQERAFHLDGKNAERVAAFVRSLVR
ncbi:CDP-glycerol glycerophosphotransferase family protein [Candidatus Uhrbacteria bacterium]|nr:CDP-glycerol glycerophosphotransferase family protein [Candidatus Uhrbacteria bacterium]